MNVKIWSDPARTTLTCQLRHADVVRVIRAEGNHALVAATDGDCSGWVTRNYLASKRPRVLGHRIE